MTNIPWILIAVFLVIVLLGIIAFFAAKSRKKRMPTDYYAFFLIGIIWLVAGIMMQLSDNATGTFFFIMGVVYVVMGLAHKKEWKKNHKPNKWKNLTKQERKFRIWIFIILGILVLAGLAALLLAGL